MLQREAERREAAEAIEVLAENRAAFEAFVGCQTQWRVGGLGTRTGLDYTAVEAWLRLMQVRKRREAFAGMRVIELGALQVWSEQAAAEAARRQH